MKARIALGVVSCAALVGCASTPPVTVNYYLPRADAKITLVRSIACDAAGENFYVANTVASSIAYSADERHRHTLAIRQLESPLANTDVSFDFAEDGRRLAGINASQTGQGTQIIGALISLAGLVLAAAKSTDDSQAIKKGCDYIATISPKEKVISVTFTADETFDAGNGPREMEVAPEDAERYSNVAIMMGAPCIALAPADKDNEPPITYKRGDRRDIDLAMRQPARVTISLSDDVVGNGCAKPSEAFWKGIATVPQRGVAYTLPIPRAAFIGKQTVVAKFSEAGALTKLSYGSETAAAAAIGSAGKAFDLVDGQTDAQRAAALDAQADVIAQQRRLLRCRADPNSCPT